MNKAINSSYT